MRSRSRSSGSPPFMGDLLFEHLSTDLAASAHELVQAVIGKQMGLASEPVEASTDDVAMCMLAPPLRV